MTSSADPVLYVIYHIVVTVYTFLTLTFIFIIKHIILKNIYIFTYICVAH